jgi:hypothetical protein
MSTVPKRDGCAIREQVMALQQRIANLEKSISLTGESLRDMMMNRIRARQAVGRPPANGGGGAGTKSNSTCYGPK